MVKKHISKKRRSPMLISKAILEKKLEQLKLEEMALKDLKKLEKMGFKVHRSVFLKKNTSSNKSFVRRKLKEAIRRDPRNKLLRTAELKRVQHPNRNIKTYIIVTKTVNNKNKINRRKR